MAAVPAGYEAFHSMRRKGVTLLCFLLASTMAMGITVYVDSYSIHEWNRNLDIGQIAIIAEGGGIQNHVDEIRAIDGVTKAASLERGYADFEYWVNETWGSYLEFIYGDIIAPSQEFMETFPGYIILEEGAFPSTNRSEIAIIKDLTDFYGFKIGDVLNLTLDWDDPPELVEIIGIYSQGGDESYNPYYWSYESIAIVVSEVIEYPDYRVFVDIDRTRLTAFSAGGSLAYSNGIDEAIRAVDPNYDPTRPWS
ncbi:MAG: hypothetical protein ACW98J_10010, partial [Candidatus Thorarchaeota archaeon]